MNAVKAKQTSPFLSVKFFLSICAAIGVLMSCTLLQSCDASDPETLARNQTLPAQRALENSSSAAESEAAPLVSTAPVPQALSAAETPFDKNEYQRVTLDFLGSFKYEHPEPAYLESVEDPALLKLKDQFPAKIRALHGKKVAVRGYVVPVSADEQWHLKSFVLVKSRLECCYGNAPQPNECIDVRMLVSKYGEEVIDIPVTVYGTLEVGEEIKYGTLLGLYRLNAVKIEFK